MGSECVSLRHGAGQVGVRVFGYTGFTVLGCPSGIRIGLGSSGAVGALAESGSSLDRGYIGVVLG